MSMSENDALGKATDSSTDVGKSVLTNHDRNKKKYHTQDCCRVTESMVQVPLLEVQRLNYVKCSFCHSIEGKTTGHTSDRLDRMKPEDIGLTPLGER